MSAAFVAIVRGSTVESRHRVHVAVAHAEQGIVAGAGDVHFVSFVRSALKMFQALPLVEDGGDRHFAFTMQELALCTASHGGEAFHLEAARSMLRKIGVPDGALACGAHPPMHAPAADALAARGEAPQRIHNNCSGKHAGMLALARLHGWPVQGYHLAYHPVQQRVAATLAHWTGAPASAMALDGCGLPTFAYPLDRVALACALFAAAAADDASSAPGRILGAMCKHPEYVAGTDRLCTDVTRVAEGRLVAKVGAEGYYCAGAPGARLGIALKVEDGARRASEPALLAVLRSLDLLSHQEIDRLGAYAHPPVLNTRGEIVGRVAAAISLQRGR